MRKHPRRLTEAGVSPARYAELRDVCRQYREMRRDVERARHGLFGRFELKSRRDPTGNTAAAVASMPQARRCRIIEQCAGDVAGRIVGRAILKSVTDGDAYARLRPPCGERQFYQLRLSFFAELDRRLWEMEWGE